MAKLAACAYIECRLGVTGSTLARLASSPGSTPGVGTDGDECKESSAWVLNSDIASSSLVVAVRGRGREAQAPDCRSGLREFESRRSR